MSATPPEIVQRQLDAYNARDLPALLACYADSARLYEHPDTLMAAGTAQLQERFAARFREPNLHARLLHRIVQGRFVIDHEQVTRTFPEGPGTQEFTLIYEVVAGRIARSWAMAGPRTMDAVR